MMQEVLQAIQVVGFPIVAFLLMYLFAKSSLEKMEKAVQDNTRAMLELRATINTLLRGRQ